VGVAEGVGVGVSAVTPPTKLSASAISKTIEISGVVSSMCSIATVRPLPATAPSIVRGCARYLDLDVDCAGHDAGKIDADRSGRGDRGAWTNESLLYAQAGE
jgi:hypothetical protein